MSKKIAMAPVKSSNVAQIGYDAATKTLAVQFINGGTYHYAGVSKEAHDSLMKSKSIGSHLQAHIVGKHKHTKL